MERSSRAAIRWVHFFGFRRFIKVMRVDCQHVMVVAPAPTNPDRKIIGPVLYVPTRCQIVEREFCLQGLDDCDEVVEKCLNGLVADIREFFLHVFRLCSFTVAAPPLASFQ